MPNPQSSVANVQPPPRPAEPGNLRRLTHGAYSARIVNPRAAEIVEGVLAAHPHLDAAKDGPALARYGVLLARLARVYDWLSAQPDDIFSDAEKGTVHAALERVERWERAAADAEHRLAIDPYTRSKLGLVQMEAFDLARAMSAAAEDGDHAAEGERS
jgi:hypothetical protein